MTNQPAQLLGNNRLVVHVEVEQTTRRAAHLIFFDGYHRVQLRRRSAHQSLGVMASLSDGAIVLLLQVRSGLSV